jgi:hypothetical protein
MTCPHCLGCNCIHCREYRAEQRRLRRGSRLTDDDRRALRLLIRPLRAMPECEIRDSRPVSGMVPVLPADFSLSAISALGAGNL